MNYVMEEGYSNPNSCPSSGATLGLVRAISDYDLLCNDRALWDMVVDADTFYSRDCYSFEKDNE